MAPRRKKRVTWCRSFNSGFCPAPVVDFGATLDTCVNQGVPPAACRAVLAHGLERASSVANFGSEFTSTAHNTETGEPKKDVKEDSTELSVPLILRTVSHVVSQESRQQESWLAFWLEAAKHLFGLMWIMTNSIQMYQTKNQNRTESFRWVNCNSIFESFFYGTLYTDTTTWITAAQHKKAALRFML